MSSKTKYVYLGAYVTVVAFGAIVGALGDDPESEPLQSVLVLPLMGGLVAMFVSALLWVYGLASSVERLEGARVDYPLFGSISTGAAVLLLLVPCLNVFWVFAFHLALTGVINRRLAEGGSRVKVPVGWAIAACLMQWVPYCNLVFGPIFWFAYMFQSDRARTALEELELGALMPESR